MSKLRVGSTKCIRRKLEVVETSTRKKARTDPNTATSNGSAPPSPYHSFSDPSEVSQLRTGLLSWYDKEKRELPWRTLALTESDINIRTYGVWVSEIMLQQTQVVTVKDYYNRWMKKWPTVYDLAASSLEEVNKMWAGLGYYSRGRRLHEGAQKVVSELKGQMPRTSDALLKNLPGVGRYTAAAIASIALGQVSGVVDGNVIRVLCRLRAIGADSTSAAVTEVLWALANSLVDPERPGDFNQAMMELGARVCTPKGPMCSQCPVQSHCRSFQKVHAKEERNIKKLLGKQSKGISEELDIEDCVKSGSCLLCPSEPWDDELGVQNFPRKPTKKAPRAERTLTCVVVRTGEQEDHEYLLVQRPSKGLLAGLWEFPSLVLQEGNLDVKQKKALANEIDKILGTRLSDDLLQYVGEVVHIFSHIHQTYVVYSVGLKKDQIQTQTHTENAQWLSGSALQDAAVSTGLKKILKLYESSNSAKDKKTNAGKELKQKTVRNGPKGETSKKSKQLQLSSFFTTLKKECGP